MTRPVSWKTAGELKEGDLLLHWEFAQPKAVRVTRNNETYNDAGDLVIELDGRAPVELRPFTPVVVIVDADTG